MNIITDQEFCGNDSIEFLILVIRYSQLFNFTAPVLCYIYRLGIYLVVYDILI